MKISWKRISKTLLLIIFLLSIVGLVSGIVKIPDHYFRLDKSHFDIPECNVQKTEHIIACNANAKSLEIVYLQMREYFGADYINKKIEIYIAKTKDFKGQIGYVDGKPVAGVYREGKVFNDVIIYNGEANTLIHELGHYFFANMKPKHVDEMFARLTELKLMADYNYTLLSVDYKNLNAKYITLQSKFVDEMNRWASRCFRVDNNVSIKKSKS